MPLSPCSRATVRLGVVVLMVAAVASAWELLAMQSPGTPFYIGMLPGPIATLRELSMVTGLLLMASGALMPWAYPEHEPRLLVALMHVGSVLALGAQLYAALHGMYGVQASDLRPDALPLFVVKYAGVAALLVAWLELGRRVLMRPAPPPT
jgi:hypothetical protein